MISIQQFRSVGTPTDRKIAFAGQLDLYPNPNLAGGQLNVLYNLPEQKDAELKIIDMLGQQIQTVALKTNSHHVSIDLDKNLAAGTYQVLLFQNNRLLALKKLSIGN